MVKWLSSLTGKTQASKLPFCAPINAPHSPATVRGLPASACWRRVKSLDVSGNCGRGLSHSGDWACAFSEIPPIRAVSTNKTPAYLAECHTLVQKQRTRILKKPHGALC